MRTKNMQGSEQHYVDNPAPASSAGLVIRQKEPKNLEAPFDRIDSYLTPTELFYIRSHFPTPNLDRDSYRLHIDGAVRRPFSLSYERLRKLRSKKRLPPREAQGTVRAFLAPSANGARWNPDPSAMQN